LDPRYLRIAFGFLSANEKLECVNLVCKTWKKCKSQWNRISIFGFDNPPKFFNVVRDCVPCSVTSVSSTHVTTEKITALRVLTKLEYVRFFYTPVLTTKSFIDLSSFSKLRSLDISGVRDASSLDFQHFAELKYLESLDVGHTSWMTNMGVELIAASRFKLKMLNLSGCNKLTPDVFGSIAKMTSLENLFLADSSFVNDTCLPFLANLLQLKRLKFGYGMFGTESLRHLLALERLETLGLSNCGDRLGERTDDGLKYLQLLPNLTDLNLSYSNWEVTDDGLEHLAKIQKLQKLSLDNNFSITDGGLKNLTPLKPYLKKLFLDGTHLITDAGLAHVAQLARLTHLTLNACVLISDAGMQHMARLKHLESLFISGCWNITNASKEALAHVKHVQRVSPW
jgi:F-box/leucine-rich repeat protein 14